MSGLEYVSIGVIMSGVIYFLFKKHNEEKRNVLLFERSAQLREDYRQKIQQNEKEIQQKIDEFKAKKAEYYKLKEKLNAEQKRITDNGRIPNNNSPADVLVLRGPSKPRPQTDPDPKSPA